jgi:hypothetical protein
MTAFAKSWRREWTQMMSALEGDTDMSRGIAPILYLPLPYGRMDWHFPFEPSAADKGCS